MNVAEALIGSIVHFLSATKSNSPSPRRMPPEAIPPIKKSYKPLKASSHTNSKIQSRSQSRLNSPGPAGGAPRPLILVHAPLPSRVHVRAARSTTPVPASDDAVPVPPQKPASDLVGAPCRALRHGRPAWCSEILGCETGEARHPRCASAVARPCPTASTSRPERRHWLLFPPGRQGQRGLTTGVLRAWIDH